MATNRQDYSPIDSLQKMVDNIPNGGGGDRKKHKKHKKDKKEQVPQQPLQPLQTTSDFSPDELFKEIGLIFPHPLLPLDHPFHPHRSPSWMKKNMISTCLFHNCNLELFQAVSNMEWYVKCPFTREC